MRQEPGVVTLTTISMGLLESNAEKLTFGIVGQLVQVISSGCSKKYACKSEAYLMLTTRKFN